MALSRAADLLKKAVSELEHVEKASPDNNPDPSLLEHGKENEKRWEKCLFWNYNVIFRDSSDSNHYTITGPAQKWDLDSEEYPTL